LSPPTAGDIDGSGEQFEGASMRWLAILGAVLIVLGIAGLVFHTVPYRQTEQVAKIGPVTATQVTEKQIEIPPYVGLIAVAAGIALVFADRWRR
jgi:hypothetical protein